VHNFQPILIKFLLHTAMYLIVTNVKFINLVETLLELKELQNWFSFLFFFFFGPPSIKERKQ